MQMTSPRLTSISVVRVMVSDWPATPTGEIAVVGGGATRTVAVLAEGTNLDLVAGAHGAAGDGAGKAAEILVRGRGCRPLHGQAERFCRQIIVNRHGFEMGHEMWGRDTRAWRQTAPPRCPRRGPRAEIAGWMLSAPMLFGEGAVIGLDIGEDLLIVVHQVHLVDRQGDMTDPEHGHEEGHDDGSGA